MTTYYVGIGGNNASDGLSWANRKLTLNGAEDIPVQAGDTVYVGAGTYREQLICDVSGGAGTPITYVGDYDGSHTDGTGGVVRIAIGANDVYAIRTSCIKATAKNYRTFRGFDLDSPNAVEIATSNDNWIIEQCIFQNIFGNGFTLLLTNPTNVTVRNCFFSSGLQASNSGIRFVHTGEVNTSGNLVENCVFVGGYYGIANSYIGDVVVKNCLFHKCLNAIRVWSINTSNPLVVTNSIFDACSSGVNAASTGMITENYNSFFANGTARTNVGVGAQSNAYSPVYDSRWFFELVAGGSILSPFDMGATSPLVNVAGTSPTTSDMRGTTVQGSHREWGALEYDSTLDIEAGAGTGGASSVKILPLGRVGL